MFLDNRLSTDVFGRLTNQRGVTMQDRRQDIVQAGIAILREYGYSGFSQPRVAARAGLRQSHLTYYYPARVDLLAAVARAAINGQVAAVDAMFAETSLDDAANAIARIAVRHDNTRVLMALVQAADQEPQLRALFRELADGIVERAGGFFAAGNLGTGDVHARLLHALAVGLAVLDLATGQPDGDRRAETVLEAAITMIMKDASPERQAPASP
jgi:AcrR family transcriptional regulator